MLSRKQAQSSPFQEQFPRQQIQFSFRIFFLFHFRQTPLLRRAQKIIITTIIIIAATLKLCEKYRDSWCETRLFSIFNPSSTKFSISLGLHREIENKIGVEPSREIMKIETSYNDISRTAIHALFSYSLILTTTTTTRPRSPLIGLSSQIFGFSYFCACRRAHSRSRISKENQNYNSSPSTSDHADHAHPLKTLPLFS